MRLHKIKKRDKGEINIDKDFLLKNNIDSVTFIGVGTDEDTTNMLYRLVINDLKRNGKIVEDSIFIKATGKF